jgi:ADP-heptose:LPS heptosyltransferase
MKVRTLQRADMWIGVPLCALLTLFRRLLPARSFDSGVRLQSLVVIKLAEQGSTVLAYPALKRAIDICGRDNVYFVCVEENRFIVDVMDIIPKTNVLTISVRTIPALIRSTLSVLSGLRKRRVDAAIDMEFLSRASAATTFLIGARRRVGFHAYFGGGLWRGDLMTHRLVYNPHLHTSDAFLTLVEAAQIDPSNLPTLPLRPVSPSEPPRFQPSTAEVSEVRRKLTEKTNTTAPWILINANAADLLPLRRWPEGRYVELARRLLAQFPEICIAFTGAPHEAKSSSLLVSQVDSPRCVSIAGETTLRELLALYSLSEVLVTNDSGPAHFAALTPIRTVTLFGPESPRLFAARTPRNKALWAEIACSPCVSAYNNRQSACQNNVCMQAIEVEQVFSSVCEAYQGKRSIH